KVGGLGTVGIPGVDAVVSDATARSLGFPAGNAIVISAPGARLSTLKSRIKAAVPRTASVEMLVTLAPRSVGGTQATARPAAARRRVSQAQVAAFLKAALSRVGMPYVWGAAGPTAFDCSGLVQWSSARAGIAMPRVAADQARTGPAVPLSQLQPGDLLFYRFDPTAPGYISHVAIYLGKGLMLQAPQPGQNVEVVPVDVGSGFAGAVAVSPAVAAPAAGHPVGWPSARAWPRVGCPSSSRLTPTWPWGVGPRPGGSGPRPVGRRVRIGPPARAVRAVTGGSGWGRSYCARSPRE